MGLNGLKHCRIILLLLIFYFTFLFGLELATSSNISVWSMLQCKVFMSNVLWPVLESLSKMICNCLKWQKSLHQQTICWCQQLYNKRQIHYKRNYLLNNSTKSVHDNQFFFSNIYGISNQYPEHKRISINWKLRVDKNAPSIWDKIKAACILGKWWLLYFQTRKGHEGSTRKTDNLHIETMKTARKYVCTESFKVGIVQLRKKETILKNVSGILMHYHLFIYLSLCPSINKSDVNEEEQELLSDQHWYQSWDGKKLCRELNF